MHWITYLYEFYSSSQFLLYILLSFNFNFFCFSVIVFQLFILCYFNLALYDTFSTAFHHELLLLNKNESLMIFSENQAISGYTDCVFTQVCARL